MEPKELKISPTNFMLGEIMSNQVAMNVKIDEYTNRVLGVIKEKYGLKDKGAALIKFAQMYGQQFVSKEDLETSKKRAIQEIKNEKDPLRLYSYKRLVEVGEDADKLFEY